MTAYRSGPPRPPQPAPPPSPGLGPNYLAKGYFDPKGNLWPELIVEEAKRVAKVIGQRQGQAELKSAQLRRFYGKARNIEQKLDSGQPFEGLKAEILAILPIAANTVARGNAPEAFKDFIERNTRLAAKDEAHFRKGFLVHFQSVVAFFTYIYRR